MEIQTKKQYSQGKAQIEEPVMVFKNGVVYRAHTRDPKPKNSLYGECEFHMAVFYKDFDGHKVIASYREHANEPIVRRILDKKIKKNTLEATCLEILKETLENDCAKDWYSNKVLVLGKPRNETINDYFTKTNTDTYIGPKNLKIKNLVEFSDE